MRRTSAAVQIMEKQYRNVLVLSSCQATLQTSGTTMISVTGLAGYALASDKSFATVPLTCYVLGSAIATIPASLLMRAIGRRAGFQVGTGLGMLGAAVCATAMYVASFWLLCAGMAVMGIYQAFGKYYRFAAADAAEIDFRAKRFHDLRDDGDFIGIFRPAAPQERLARRQLRLDPVPADRPRRYVVAHMAAERQGGRDRPEG